MPTWWPLFIARSYYNKDENGDEDPESKGKAEIIIAKQRNGPTGSVHLAYLADYTRFENLQGGGGGGELLTSPVPPARLPAKKSKCLLTQCCQ